MCQNNPNCNCPNCTQCQDCEQVVPNCTTTTTTTCTSEQFTEECPNGKQSTDCLVYTGPNLKNCNNQDTLFRGTEFNDFLSNLWETVKCAATPSTDTIDYTGANILDCNGNILVPTNTPVTEALNSIWEEVKCPVIPKATDLIIEDLALTDCDNNDVLVGDYTVFDTITSVWEYVKCLGNTSTSDNITFTQELKTCDNIPLTSGTGNLTDALTTIWENIKCWYKDLTTEINKKQPVWQVSNIVTVGAGQPAPFNNIETAVAELSKYHFDGKPIIIELLAGTYTITSSYWYSTLLRSGSEVIFRKAVGSSSVVIQGTLTSAIIAQEEGLVTFDGIEFVQNGSGGVIYVTKNGQIQIKNCLTIQNSNSSNQPLLTSEFGGKLLIIDSNVSLVNNSNNITTLVQCRFNGYMHLRVIKFVNNSNNGLIGCIEGRVHSKIEVVLFPGICAENFLDVFYIDRQSELFINASSNTTFNNINGTFLHAEINSNIFIEGGGNLIVNSLDSYNLIRSIQNCKIESINPIISNNFWNPVEVGVNSSCILGQLTSTNVHESILIYNNSYFRVGLCNTTFKSTIQNIAGLICSNNSYVHQTSGTLGASTHPIKYIVNGYSKLSLDFPLFGAPGVQIAAGSNYFQST